MTTAELALSDFIHQSSRCGLRVDKTHSAPFGCDDHGGIADWSNGRPFDGMSLGEWGAITETGLRVFLDPFMVQLAVDEATGVFAFYHDQLLRLAGYNTQMFSGGHEIEVGVDQGEVHHYDGFTPYPWEQCGAPTPGMDPYRECSDRRTSSSTRHTTAPGSRTDDDRCRSTVRSSSGATWARAASGWSWRRPRTASQHLQAEQRLRGAVRGEPRARRALLAAFGQGDPHRQADRHPGREADEADRGCRRR